MLILADLGHDPKHWPSEAATAADKAFLVSRHRRFGTSLMRICHIDFCCVVSILTYVVIMFNDWGQLL